MWILYTGFSFNYNSFSRKRKNYTDDEIKEKYQVIYVDVLDIIKYLMLPKSHFKKKIVFRFII